MIRPDGHAHVPTWGERANAEMKENRDVRVLRNAGTLAKEELSSY
jgi:hypothetical protein